jgi:hypothetical protein
MLGEDEVHLRRPRQQQVRLFDLGVFTAHETQ